MLFPGAQSPGTDTMFLNVRLEKGQDGGLGTDHLCWSSTCCSCCCSSPALGAHLGSDHVLRVLLFAGRRVEDDVVDGLYQLQLNHALDEEAGQQLLVCIRR